MTCMGHLVSTALGAATSWVTRKERLGGNRTVAVLHSTPLGDGRRACVQSSNVVRTWIREEKLVTLIPNAPTITSGKVIARGNDLVALRGAVIRGSARPSPWIVRPR